MVSRLIKRRGFLVAAILACWLGLSILLRVPVCHDRAFVDRSTGSRKGYRQWFTGGLSKTWYRESRIEAFMRSRHPDKLVQQWTSYEGTGRNVFGSALVRGHGMPGAIMQLVPEKLNEYCRRLSDDDLLHLYDALAEEDTDKTDKLVDQIWQTIRDPQ